MLRLSQIDGIAAHFNCVVIDASCLQCVGGRVSSREYIKLHCCAAASESEAGHSVHERVTNDRVAIFKSKLAGIN